MGFITRDTALVLCRVNKGLLKFLRLNFTLQLRWTRYTCPLLLWKKVACETLRVYRLVDMEYNLASLHVEVDQLNMVKTPLKVQRLGLIDGRGRGVVMDNKFVTATNVTLYSSISEFYLECRKLVVEGFNCPTHLPYGLCELYLSESTGLPNEVFTMGLHKLTLNDCTLLDPYVRGVKVKILTLLDPRMSGFVGGVVSELNISHADFKREFKLPLIEGEMSLFCVKGSQWLQGCVPVLRAYGSTYTVEPSFIRQVSKRLITSPRVEPPWPYKVEKVGFDFVFTRL